MNNERELPFVLRFEFGDSEDPLVLQDVRCACADHNLAFTIEPEGIVAVTVTTVREAFLLGCCLGTGYLERRRRREFGALLPVM